MPVPEPKEIRRALEYIAGNLKRPMTLDAIAAAAGMGKSGFARLFREHVGVPPHQYIVQLRLERARALLASGRSCGEIASQAGFSDQSHLNRWFRRAYGVTPGEYRRTLAA
jgi:AraC-like DNA-binding protein